jgi:exodeoxyribonuclease VII large subunit
MEFAGLAGRLNSLNPLAVLTRGYSVVTDTNSRKIVAKKSDVYIDQLLTITLTDGDIECKVTKGN